MGKIMNEEKTNIYTLFLPCYSSKKNEILNKLQESCKDANFIGFDELSGIMDVKGAAKIYQNIRKLKDTLDGILIFGGYLDNSLTSLELPIIMVRALLGTGDWDKGILNFYRNKKVLSVCLSDVDKSLSFSSSRFNDLLEKIKLIIALKKIKNSKLLCIQESDILGSYDISGMDFHIPLPDDYNGVYSKRLKEIGLIIEHISLTDLNREIQKIKENEAEEITNIWIKEAEEVTKGTNKEEILKSAKMYLGVRNLMEEYNANGITIRSLVPWVKGIINVTPCLVNTELNKQLKVGVCEGLVNSAVTEMFGIYIADEPSFIGDVVGIDKINETITFAHCQSPINPHGDDRVPYIIRSHALQRGNKMLPDDYPEAGSNPSAVVEVKLPIDEVATAVKFSLYNKKIAVSKGITVPGEKLYKDFNNILCRTKLVIKTDTDAFEKKYDTVTFGVHRNIFYGDLREKIKDLATLIGFEVIEEDK